MSPEPNTKWIVSDRLEVIEGEMFDEGLKNQMLLFRGKAWDQGEVVFSTREQALARIMQIKRDRWRWAEIEMRDAELAYWASVRDWHTEAYKGKPCGLSWCIICRPEFVSTR